MYCYRADWNSLLAIEPLVHVLPQKCRLLDPGRMNEWEPHLAEVLNMPSPQVSPILFVPCYLGFTLKREQGQSITILDCCSLLSPTLRVVKCNHRSRNSARIPAQGETWEVQGAENNVKCLSVKRKTIPSAATRLAPAWGKGCPCC